MSGVGNRGKGRKKGVPNKATASAKTAFTMAFDGIGGAQALQEWAKDNRTDFYKLFSRLIPTEVNGDGGGALVLRIVREDRPS